MYINRLFFRKDTGALIDRYEMNGCIIVATTEQDLASRYNLKGYNPESIEVIEIPVEDLETRENIRMATNISLNIETKELIFDFTPEQIEEIERQKTLEEKVAEQEQAIMELTTALALLQGGTE